jgi:hypothetical protein
MLLIVAPELATDMVGPNLECLGARDEGGLEE